MIKKLVRHGNSLALVLDKPILELLKIEPETPLKLSTDGIRIVISPMRSSARQRSLEASLKKMDEMYSQTLIDLAKGPQRSPEEK